MAAPSLASPCPKCSSHRIHPSRLRSLFERLRRAVTETQPYRCHGCNYRAWYVMQVLTAAKPDKRPDDLRTSKTHSNPVTADDLDRLDSR